MGLAGSILWILFGICYIAWQAHKEYPGTVLAFAVAVLVFIVPPVLYFLIADKLADAGYYTVSIIMDIIFLIAILVLFIRANKNIYRDKIIPKIVAKEVSELTPTDAEIEETILKDYGYNVSIYFGGYSEQEKRRRYLTPGSDRYYKTCYAVRMEATKFWRNHIYYERLAKEKEEYEKMKQEPKENPFRDLRESFLLAFGNETSEERRERLEQEAEFDAAEKLWEQDALNDDVDEQAFADDIEDEEQDQSQVVPYQRHRRSDRHKH